MDVNGARSSSAASMRSSTGSVDEIVFVLPASFVDDAAAVIGRVLSPTLRAVAGGSRRQDSVVNGVAAVSDRADLVLVHDAARPFVSTGLIGATIAAAAEHGAAIVAVRAHDTVKQVAPLDGALIITRTIPRDEVYLAQTPQGLQARRAGARPGAVGHARGHRRGVAGRALGLKVAIVPSATNIKVTVPADLVLAGAIAGTRANTADRKVE
jgi:2-C-methyl-D-erythritol 4-phosphate cytidylyltransferase